MRNLQDLRPYQQHGVDHVIDNPYSALFLGVGLGKTVTTLTAIAKVLTDEPTLRVLVVAPKKVAETVWHVEGQNWGHLRHLTFSLVLGDARRRKEALQARANIYVTNRENVVWLTGLYGGMLPFDWLVIDELSSFKSNNSHRFKALKVARPRLKRVTGLTGTPMPNGLLDLWPQMYLLDMGERLGKTIGGYREKYFTPGKRNGAVVYDYNLKRSDNVLLGPNIFEREIFDKIGDICISMKAKDYLDLPPRTDTVVDIEMSPELSAQYEAFEETAVLQYVADLQKTEGQLISAVNAASLTNKLLQFANGAVYADDAQDGKKGINRPFIEIHTAKLDDLGEKLEAANGEPMLVFYQFQSDIVRIQKYLKEYRPYLLDKAHTLRDVERWNRREIPVMLLHAASAGHGLNLQHGGRLMYWYGRPWSLELYQQGLGRLDRSGQSLPVMSWTGSLAGSMDEKVIASHASKDRGQNALLDAVKALVHKYSR